MDAFLATILPVGFNYAPDGWQMCWGQQLPVNQYAAVYSLITTIYGGNQINFNLPDLRGAMPMAFGLRPGSNVSYQIGNKGGNDSVSLNASQMPLHTHGAVFTPTGTATVNIPAQTGSQTATLNVNPIAGTTQLPSAGAALSGGGTGTTRIYSSSLSNPVALDNGSVSITGNAPTAAQSVATNAITGGTVAVQPAGNASPIDARPPFLAINFIFCMQGLYPSRP